MQARTLLMSLKAAFEADYALLGTVGQLIVMFGQKPWQISETLECSFKTDISQQKYSIKKVNRGKKDEKTYFTRQKHDLWYKRCHCVDLLDLKLPFVP